MLLDVITRLASDTGYSPVSQRASLVNLANRAATDIYNTLECNKIYREVTLVVTPNAVVALPNFIGELRGARMHTMDMPFDLQSVGSPRYVSSTWNYRVKNWRDLGESVVHTVPGQIAPLTFTSTVVEGKSILISGQTNNAFREQEVLLLNASPKSTTKLFGPRIDQIACMDIRSSDIIVADADGTELATLYNTENKTRYKLIDVSQVFWSSDTIVGESLIDVAYKVKQTRLVNDSDSFYAGDDYDNAWYHWAMHLFLKPLENRAQDATDERIAAISALVATKDTSEGEIVKKMSFGRNKFYGNFRRWMNYKSNYQSGYGSVIGYDS